MIDPGGVSNQALVWTSRRRAIAATLWLAAAVINGSAALFNLQRGSLWAAWCAVLLIISAYYLYQNLRCWADLKRSPRHARIAEAGEEMRGPAN